jgi:thiol-disulfide isomerase/thioredoxin
MMISSIMNVEVALKILILLAALFLTGCSAFPPKEEQPEQLPAAALGGSAALPDLGKAPEWTNQVWLNTETPLRLADLHGKVVLLDMWTFDCINCRNVVPSLIQWHNTYKDQGLVVVGNHYPEFGFERDLKNLSSAIQELGIPYPVAQDNDGATWEAYHNQYWPTLYLIDKQGHIRYVKIGEGQYDVTGQAIETLLAEPLSGNIGQEHPID